MIRPECYQCARCGKPWREFYPRVTCPCGCDVLKLTPKSKEPAPAPVDTAAAMRAFGLDGLGALALGLLGGVLVERLAKRQERIKRAERVDVDVDDLDDAPAGWSPYPLGNGTEGVINGA